MESLGYVPQSFLEYFTSDKCPRRAPLINRGYYIRYQAMDWVLQKFIRALENYPGGVQVVSLGCGYDPTYFRLFNNNQHENMKWIDVDFSELTKIKKQMIGKSDILCQSLVDYDAAKDPADTIHSRYYHLVPCDLRDTRTLSQELEKIEGFDYTVPTLVLSECVITYIPTTDADTIIKWSSDRFTDSLFVLYEQINPDDAFARQMLKHFKKLDAAIHAIHSYPRLEDQIQRLLKLGYDTSVAYDMNDLWYRIIDNEERRRIKEIEWFDEYEEWNVKCRHYFVSIGCRKTKMDLMSQLGMPPKLECDINIEESKYRFLVKAMGEPSGFQIKRWGHTATRVENALLVFGGYGLPFAPSTDSKPQKFGRFNDLLIIHNFFDQDPCRYEFDIIPGDPKSPPARMYHTSIAHGSQLFIFGGRNGPSKVFGDCWTFDLRNSCWTEKRCDFSPQPRFRHAAFLLHDVKLPNYDYFGDVWVISGGVGIDEQRNQLRVLNDLNFYLVDRNQWVSIESHDMHHRHSHQIYVRFQDDNQLRLDIFGGLSEEFAHAFPPFYSQFTIDLSSLIMIHRYSSNTALYRYGFKLCFLSHLNCFGVFGGVSPVTNRHADESGVLLLDYEQPDRIKHAKLNTRSLHSGMDIVHDEIASRISVIGGGAICFSMGSHFDASFSELIINHKLKGSWVDSATKIPEYNYEEIQNNFELMEGLVKAQKPFILRNIPVGSCVEKWQTRQYLNNSVKESQKISVHVSETSKLGFSGGKNYEYKVLSWTDFMERLHSSQDHCYLRSVGVNMRKDASHFFKSFPGLASDFLLPSNLAKIISGLEEPVMDSLETQLTGESESTYFSSVLRMSTSGLQLWTHYDIMNNFLFQVTGTKFVSLFPPDQAANLYVPNGINQSSSPILDIYSPYADPYSCDFMEDGDLIRKKYPLFFEKAVHAAHVGEISAGDAVFIPSLWFHNTYAKNMGTPAISINIFWKSLENQFYDRKDLYGNKDLIKASEAFSHMDRAVACIRELQDSEKNDLSSYRKFYLARMIDALSEELKQQNRA